jgi:hypothetical protein
MEQEKTTFTVRSRWSLNRYDWIQIIMLTLKIRILSTLRSLLITCPGYQHLSERADSSSNLLSELSAVNNLTAYSQDYYIIQSDR